MMKYTALVCLCLIAAVSAFPGKGRHHGPRRCGEDGPDVDRWTCYKAKKACRVVDITDPDNQQTLKEEPCGTDGEGNDIPCAGAFTTYSTPCGIDAEGNAITTCEEAATTPIRTLSFQMCEPANCRPRPSLAFLRCMPRTEPEERFGKGRFPFFKHHGPPANEGEEEGAFIPPPQSNEAVILLCGEDYDELDEQKWYRAACLVQQNGIADAVKDVECPREGTCSEDTETNYSFDGIAYTARFCTGCEPPSFGNGPGRRGGPRGGQGKGKGFGRPF